MFARVRVNNRGAWLLPAVPGAAVIAYIIWGAWVSAHDVRWLFLNRAWWRIGLHPDNDWTLLAAIGLWLAVFLCYWWPRRLQSQAMGLIPVVAMVLIGGVLGATSLAPCRGGQTRFVISAWVLGLYVGNPPSAYQSQACPGQPPLALQLGQFVCLGATLAGAAAATAVLWRQPVGRLRARFVRDATVFTGLDVMTIPLLRRLARTGRRSGIVVIEPDGSHPLLDEARAAGAHVMIGDPASPRLLLPVIAGWRGCALSYLYALRQDVAKNEAVLSAASSILRRYRPDPERQPHLVARIDDPRHANHWRGWRSGTSSMWFEDALSSQESTARVLVHQVLRTGARHLLLSGDSTLALAILLELARCSWERQELSQAAAAGRSAHPDSAGQDESRRRPPAPFPLERVVLLDQRSADLRREYLATSPHSMVEALPTVIAQPGPWHDQLLATLDAMTPGAAAESAVIITDTVSEDSLHEAGRVARLHRDTPVFVHTGYGASTTGAIFDLLHPFQGNLLVDGEVPEDTWSRVARHWHECFRLRHPPVPGDPRTLTDRPWADLDDFIRQDNILQLRSIMTAVVSCGRRWVPGRAVAPGSFIELSDRDLEAVASAEHSRWYRRRLAAGWSAGPEAGDPPAAREANARVNGNVVQWSHLPDSKRAESIEYLRSQLAQLEDIGFMPVVPAGGPPGAGKFLRIGTVRAWRLQAHRAWTRKCGDELSGAAGDWRVLDDSGDERTVRDEEFRASHEPLGGDLWRRTGTFSAWQVSDSTTLRTIEGRAIARAGDWIVEGQRGERWPVTDDQFTRSYRISDGLQGT